MKKGREGDAAADTRQSVLGPRQKSQAWRGILWATALLPVVGGLGGFFLRHGHTVPPPGKVSPPPQPPPPPRPPMWYSGMPQEVPLSLVSYRNGHRFFSRRVNQYHAVATSDGGKNVWLATKYGVKHIVGKTRRLYTREAGLPGQNIVAIAADGPEVWCLVWDQQPSFRIIRKPDGSIAGSQSVPVYAFACRYDASRDTWVTEKTIEVGHWANGNSGVPVRAPAKIVMTNDYVCISLGGTRVPSMQMTRSGGPLLYLRHRRSGNWSSVFPPGSSPENEEGKVPGRYAPNLGEAYIAVNFLAADSTGHFYVGGTHGLHRLAPRDTAWTPLLTKEMVTGGVAAPDGVYVVHTGPTPYSGYGAQTPSMSMITRTDYKTLERRDWPLPLPEETARRGPFGWNGDGRPLCVTATEGEVWVTAAPARYDGPFSPGCRFHVIDAETGSMRTEEVNNPADLSRAPAEVLSAIAFSSDGAIGHNPPNVVISEAQARVQPRWHDPEGDIAPELGLKGTRFPRKIQDARSGDTWSIESSSALTRTGADGNEDSFALPNTEETAGVSGNSPRVQGMAISESGDARSLLVWPGQDAAVQFPIRTNKSGKTIPTTARMLNFTQVMRGSYRPPQGTPLLSDPISGEAVLLSGRLIQRWNSASNRFDVIQKLEDNSASELLGFDNGNLYLTFKDQGIRTIRLSDKSVEASRAANLPPEPEGIQHARPVAVSGGYVWYVAESVKTGVNTPRFVTGYSLKKREWTGRLPLLPITGSTLSVGVGSDSVLPTEPLQSSFLMAPVAGKGAAVPHVVLASATLAKVFRYERSSRSWQQVGPSLTWDKTKSHRGNDNRNALTLAVANNRHLCVVEVSRPVVYVYDVRRPVGWKTLTPPVGGIVSSGAMPTFATVSRQQADQVYVGNYHGLWRVMLTSGEWNVQPLPASGRFTALSLAQTREAVWVTGSVWPSVLSNGNSPSHVVARFDKTQRIWKVLGSESGYPVSTFSTHLRPMSDGNNLWGVVQQDAVRLNARSLRWESVARELEARDGSAKRGAHLTVNDLEWDETGKKMWALIGSELKPGPNGLNTVFAPRLARYDAQQKQWTLFPTMPMAEETGENINAVKITPQPGSSKVWVATGNGAWQFDAAQKRWYRYAPPEVAMETALQRITRSGGKTYFTGYNDVLEVSRP